VARSGSVQFVESGFGCSIIGGDDQPVFLAVLVFECSWYLTRHTNAVGRGAIAVRRAEDVGRRRGPASTTR